MKSMKSLTRRILVSLVLSAVTLFTAPSIYAKWCTFSLVDSDGNYLGHCGCGSSAGNYCFDADGNDITDDLDGAVDALCAMMCPGYDAKNITTPSTPLMFKYPKSYQVAQANLNELRRLKQTESASPFARTSLYELVLR